MRDVVISPKIKDKPHAGIHEASEPQPHLPVKICEHCDTVIEVREDEGGDQTNAQGTREAIAEEF